MSHALVGNEEFTTMLIPTNIVSKPYNVKFRIVVSNNGWEVRTSGTGYKMKSMGVGNGKRSETEVNVDEVETFNKTEVIEWKIGVTE